MAFSKFDPHREPEAEPEAATPAGARRIRILRWVTWITMVYTAIGFAFIAYWLYTAP